MFQTFYLIFVHCLLFTLRFQSCCNPNKSIQRVGISIMGLTVYHFISKLHLFWVELTLLFQMIIKFKFNHYLHFKVYLYTLWLVFAGFPVSNAFTCILLFNWHHFCYVHTKRSNLLSKHYEFCECAYFWLLSSIVKRSISSNLILK
jgi:hypothetical protein